MEFTFLGAARPLSKTFFLDADGKLQKRQYPMVKNFTSYTERIDLLPELLPLLNTHAEQGHALLKGVLSRPPLDDESRAGSTQANSLTSWLCLDFDGLGFHKQEGVPVSIQILHDIDVRLANTTHIVQYSNSHGVDENKLNLHVFILLEKEQSPIIIKQWLKHVNFKTRSLRNQITLTRSLNSIHWPLDITACQNDKLIYIAPPVLEEGVDLPPTKLKFELITGEYNSYPLALDDLDYDLTEAQNTVYNQLREANGLSKRLPITKLLNNNMVDLNPSPCNLTGMKVDGEWVHINLNGGDSWGYYHHITQPEYLFNFKHEPIYLIRVLLPDYYHTAVEMATIARHNKVKPEERSESIFIYFIGRDKRVSKYFECKYDSVTKIVELNYTKERKMLTDFCAQMTIPMPAFVPIWNIIYKPLDFDIVNFDMNKINLWKPSIYYNVTEEGDFAFIEQIIRHALGDCDETYNRFINWLAFIFQTGLKSEVAWVLHGVPGTGKGVLFDMIIAPLFHPSNAHTMNVTQFTDDNFNTWLSSKQLVCINEIDTGHQRNLHKFNALFKERVTGDIANIRGMHREAVNLPTWTNFLLFSNKPNAAQIDEGDRRISVAPKQLHRLEHVYPRIGLDLKKVIPEQLPAFAYYLQNYKVDVFSAMRPMENSTKEEMRFVTQDPMSELVGRALAGDFDFFFRTLPEKPERTLEYIEYVSWIKDVGQELTSRPLTRDNMKVIISYMIGKENGKLGVVAFQKYLAKYGFAMSPIKVNGVSTMGRPIAWQSTMSKDKLKERLELL